MAVLDHISPETVIIALIVLANVLMFYPIVEKIILWHRNRERWHEPRERLARRAR